MEINMLPAGSGDCFFIHYTYQGKGHNILVDGGRRNTYRDIKKHLDGIIARDEYVELLVVTHVDNDHIFGILQLFRDDTKKGQEYQSRIKRVLFNSSVIIAKLCDNDARQTGTPSPEPRIPVNSNLCAYEQGIELHRKLSTLGILEEKAVIVGTTIDLPGAKMKIICPDKDILGELHKEWGGDEKREEVSLSTGDDYAVSFMDLSQRKYTADTSVSNKSSIAFILEHDNKTVLMLGDSWAEAIVPVLKKLGYSRNNKFKCDSVKLSHHGGKCNTSHALVELLDCSQFLISSNKAGYPQKETLARIVMNIECPTFILNYEKRGMLLPGEEKLCIIKTSRIVVI